MPPALSAKQNASPVCCVWFKPAWSSPTIPLSPWKCSKTTRVQRQAICMRPSICLLPVWSDNWREHSPRAGPPELACRTWLVSSRHPLQALDGSTIRVADENSGAADPPQCTFYCGDVAFECVEALLDGHRLIPFRLKRGRYLVKARAVGPDAVAEYYTLLFRHISFLVHFTHLLAFTCTLLPLLRTLLTINASAYGNRTRLYLELKYSDYQRLTQPRSSDWFGQVRSRLLWNCNHTGSPVRAESSSSTPVIPS